MALLLIASGTFQTLIALASVFLAVNYCVCCLALVVLRRREPDAARPFRAWGYPWSAAIVVAGAVVFLAGVLVSDTASAREGGGIAGGGADRAGGGGGQSEKKAVVGAALCVRPAHGRAPPPRAATQGRPYENSTGSLNRSR